MKIFETVAIIIIALAALSIKFYGSQMAILWGPIVGPVIVVLLWKDYADRKKSTAP